MGAENVSLVANAMRGLLVGAGAVGILIGCIVFFVLHSKRASREQARLVEEAKRAGWVVPARVVDSSDYYLRQRVNGERDDARGEYRKRMEYAYTVGGKEYRIKRTYGEGEIRKALVRTVEVYYDPKDPSRALLSTDSPKQEQGPRSCLMTVLLFVLLSVVFVFVVGLFV